ncbi:hypothetical protein Y032_0002g582 [Ancylostoma ceylanicum]|uniref:Uncharacterized protein n=1 Tax=Ancylostoma ceylanicum TaxID=53326 RepID=A0A016W0I6_9BILA|nr:hypothetical protein Y032_0002g582 [Ancylostoma ceylanicum]
MEDKNTTDPYSNGRLQKHYKNEFPGHVCASRASSRRAGRLRQDGSTRPHRTGTRPHPTHLVWLVVPLGHGFNRASVGQTSPVGLACFPPQRKQD